VDQGVLKVPKGYLDEKEKEAMKGTLWEAFMYLYGMKDEGFKWGELFTWFMISIGFEPSPKDDG